jgi:hypothetical protein
MASYRLNFANVKAELKVNQIKYTNLSVFKGEAIIADTFFAERKKIFDLQANVV